MARPIGTRSRALRLGVAGALIVLLTAAAPGTSQLSTLQLSSTQLAARGEAISSRIMELQRSGQGQRSIDRTMAREFGLVPVAATAETALVALSSDASCVNLPKPTAYYDHGMHIVSASWSWKNKPGTTTRCWTSDTSVYGGNVGGADAFGIYLNREIIYRSSGGNAYTETNVRTQFVNPEDWDAYGVVYKGQDRSNTGNREYTWDHGNVWMYFNVLSCTGTQTFTLKSKMGHTWSSTLLSGASVSDTGISFTFTKVENRWQAVNPVAGIYTPC